MLFVIENIIFLEYLCLKLFIGIAPTYLSDRIVINVYVNGDDTRGAFYEYSLILIPAWISNHMPSKEWDEITYPFPNLIGLRMAM